MSDAAHATRIQQLLRNLSAVPDPNILERLAHEVLSERPVELLADFLCTLGRMARDEKVRVIYTAIVRLCIGGVEPDDETRAELYSAVSARGMGAYVRYLLPLPPARTHLDSEVPHDPVLEEMPLGMKKWQARLQDRHILSRLAREGDVRVMSILLDNPRVIEDDVVTWAARRPLRPEALLEVARHRRWSLRPRVQEAVARNPYSPAHVAASYMPVLASKLLRLIEHDASLHELVRGAANENLSLREER